MFFLFHLKIGKLHLPVAARQTVIKTEPEFARFLCSFCRPEAKALLRQVREPNLPLFRKTSQNPEGQHRNPVKFFSHLFSPLLSHDSSSIGRITKNVHWNLIGWQMNKSPNPGHTFSVII